MTSIHSTTPTDHAVTTARATRSQIPDNGYRLDVDRVTKRYGKNVVVDDLTFTAHLCDIVL